VSSNVHNTVHGAHSQPPHVMQKESKSSEKRDSFRKQRCFSETASKTIKFVDFDRKICLYNLIFIHFQSTNTDKVDAERTEITDTSIIVTKAKPAKRQISLKKLVKSFSRVRYSLEKKNNKLKNISQKTTIKCVDTKSQYSCV
jgi:hypothetical protein